MLRRLTALAFIVLAALAVAHYLADSRRDVARFLETYAFDLRRPEVVESARLEISDDFAAYAAADAAIRDAIEPVNLNDLTPETRQAWLAMVPRLGQELSGAQTLMTRAAAERPGWPYHRAMLGRLAYVAHRREGRQALAEKSQLWITPLRSAMNDAPSDNSLPQLLATRVLETAPALPAETLEQLAPVVARSLSDREFVDRALVAATAVYGTDRALAMLPDEPAALDAAFRIAVDAGAVSDAAGLRKRWERAEWFARETELAAIEQRAKRNDIDALRRLVPAWAAKHRPEDFDT
ncbi:MAG: protein kinase family protein, partial [Thermoanaerobaculia bacterium]